MDDLDIYGKHTKDIPGLNTLRTLEKRKNYILKKLQEKIEEKSYLTYLIKETRALEKAINFIKFIQNNLSSEYVKEIIKQYKIENVKNIDEEIEAEAEIETENENEKKDEIVMGILNVKQSENHKFEIIFSKENNINYVSIESQRRRKKILWEKKGKVKITINRLEKILKTAKEIEENKGKDNGTPAAN